MTLQELRYIVALERFGHFGKAAEYCHVSQPTLSLGLKKLEDELGVSLFERGTQLSVTPLGERIIDQAKLALQQADRIKELAEIGHDELNAPLRIGAIYTIAPYLFPHLLPQMKQLAPNMPLLIEEGYTATLRQKLSLNELDAIIISLPFSQPHCVTRRLYDEPFVALLPSDHPLSEKQEITEQQLLEETILLLGEGHCFRDQVLNASPQLAHHLDDETQQDQNLLSRYSGTSLETLKHMVAGNVGITILPSSASEENRYYPDKVTAKPYITSNTGKPISREIAICWRVTFPRSKAIDILIDAITQCQITA